MKKGFTLIELIICFAIITIVSVALFRSVLVIEKQETKEIQYNAYITFAYVFNTTIQEDFIDKKVTEIKQYGINNYGIIYNNSEEVVFKVENGYLIYGSNKEKIPTGYTLYDDISFSLYTSNTTGLNSYLLLTVPMKNSNSASYADLKYMYQFDSNTTTAPTIPSE